MGAQAPYTSMTPNPTGLSDTHLPAGRAVLAKGLQRMLTPALVVSLYYFWKYRAKISPRAEVDLTTNLQFGEGAVVSSFTKIKATDGPVVFGKRAGIANGCFIASGTGGITIGDNFICGANVNIVASNYVHVDKDKHLEDQGSVSKGIRIGANVWIGSGCTVTDGAVIGDNVIVAANSLVNRRYKSNQIVQGSPAKTILKR
jgi:acetyltransferase-like isoleucine patch superfamily enzyme